MWYFHDLYPIQNIFMLAIILEKECVWNWDNAHFFPKNNMYLLSLWISYFGTDYLNIHTDQLELLEEETVITSSQEISALQSVKFQSVPLYHSNGIIARDRDSIYNVNITNY